MSGYSENTIVNLEGEGHTLHGDRGCNGSVWR